jgi:hypothetical protein
MLVVLSRLAVRRVQLGLVGAERGFPETLVVDNGPELRGRALEEWA